EETDPLLSPEEIQARKALQEKINEINKTRPRPLPAVMGVTDAPKPVKAHLLKRGDYRNKGDEVEPGFPTVLSGSADVAPDGARKQLADWIVNEDNPLTRRVAVNRIWQY